MSGTITYRILYPVLSHGLKGYESYNLFSVIEPAAGGKKQAPERYLITHENLTSGTNLTVDPLNEIAAPRPDKYLRYQSQPVRVYRPASVLKDVFVVAAEVKDKNNGRFPIAEKNLQQHNFYKVFRESTGGYDPDDAILVTRQHLYPRDTIPIGEALHMNMVDAQGLPMRMHHRILDDGDRIMRITRAFCRAPA